VVAFDLVSVIYLVIFSNKMDVEDRFRNVHISNRIFDSLIVFIPRSLSALMEEIYIAY
jgi:hypothetical protein